MSESTKGLGFRSPLAVLLLCTIGVGASARAEIAPAGSGSGDPGTVSFDAGSQSYRLTTADAPATVYTVSLAEPQVQAGMLRVQATLGAGTPATVVAAAGTRYRNAAGAIVEPEALAALSSPTLVEHRIDGNTVVLRYAEQPEGTALSKTFRLALSGRALVLRASSGANTYLRGYAGLSLGHAEGLTGARAARVPYCPEPLLALADGSYLSAYVDRTLSGSARVQTRFGPGPGDALFAHAYTTMLPRTDDAMLPLDEVAYITVAPALQAVLPQISGPASPHRAGLSPRLVLDVWGLDQQLGAPREGVSLSWTPPAGATGNATVTVRASDGNAACGDGVQLSIWRGAGFDEELDRILVENGASAPLVWTRTLQIHANEPLRVDTYRRATNFCDSTALRLTIAAADGETYDSVDDFSSTAGHRGFAYLEVVGETTTPMQWDGARWAGSGAFSLGMQGAVHPGARGADAYRAGRTMIARLVEYGLADLAVIYHVWQRHGYDAGLPEHYPANPARGTSAEMTELVTAARDAGMRFALHENYVDMYPDNPPDHPSPLYDETAIALDPDGSRRQGWYNAGTGQQAYRIAAARMAGFAATQGALIAAAYAPNAAYLDVNTGWAPELAIDFAAGAAIEPTLAASYQAHLTLFAAMRSRYNGPLFGEGGEGQNRFDSYYAGAVDAVERQVEGRAAARLLPHFELLSVKPRMLNHGMGYYCRYFVAEGQGDIPPARLDLDQYRASEIAFGHAGFLGDCLPALPPEQTLTLFAREYWLMRALQQRYADARPTRIAYDSGGALVAVDELLRGDDDLARVHARLHLEYDSGLVVRVNRDAARAVISPAAGFSTEQGRNGFGYFEQQGDGAYLPLFWDPEGQRWQGSQTFSRLGATGGHPQGVAVLRRWTSPANVQVDISGRATAPGTCGDGVELQVLGPAGTLWSATLGNGQAAREARVELEEVTLAAGESIGFRVAQRGDPNCDSFGFAPTIAYDDGKDHDWSVTTPGGTLVLPPSGFAAHDNAGFAAFSARQGDARVDYVASPEYRYAATRGTAPVTVGELTVDGAVALVAGPHGENLHVIGATAVQQAGTLLLRLSSRSHFNLRWVDARLATLVARFAESCCTVDATLGSALPATWREALAGHPGALELAPADAEGQPAGSWTPLTFAGGEATLPELKLDRPYLLRITAPCLSADECVGDQVCARGACAAPPDGGPAGDGSSRADGGPTADASAPGSDAGSAGGDGSTEDDGSGCACELSKVDGAPLPLLLLLLVARCRRRRC